MPPPESYHVRLEKILAGEDTFKSLQAASAANPKDVAAAFRLARKWAQRGEQAKALEKYREVAALDPGGSAGTYTDDQATRITAPYSDFARFRIAAAALQRASPTPVAMRTFIAEHPGSPLVKQAYRQLSDYYYARAPKSEADPFFAEYAARFPDDPAALVSRLRRIVDDKGPIEKGRELAAALREITAWNPDPDVTLALVRFYEFAGDRGNVDGVFGVDYLARHTRTFASGLYSYGDYWAGRKENLEGAKQAAAMLAALDPLFLQQAVSIYLKAGDATTALGLYGPAWLETNAPSLPPIEINAYATFWLRHRANLESALVAVRKALALDSNFYYWSTLSQVSLALGDKAEAIRAAEKAVETAPPGDKVGMQLKLAAVRAAAEGKK